MSERRDLYFAVDGGATLELAHKYVADRSAVEKSNRELAKEFGAEQYVVSLMDGVLCGAVFADKPHPEFKKPNRRGVSFPKRGSACESRLASIEGYDHRGYGLAETLGVPTVIDYTTEDGWGSSVISRGVSSGVGFLYMSEDGPFALYIPDVAQVVAEYEGRGYAVSDVCKNFKPEFDGARPILKEEWELVVAQHEFAEAKRAAEMAVTA
ncbi:hypothetical protein [Rhizobium laguerreae]|uniref:hypothetical protein n=1 Tax=Rhizobium laguerreae TaxID=1076926 RepID=UPI001C91C39C|nr:hypothetical protein [Rhizobium laguerreae]MBY3434849.1 hypothetical protein [Rhizobium laguerreae]MBY3448992.1 hypothetical protein [Rhizobium laguerreae]MBY3456766.1 hypothetical protein [Rhizobium laguerreae]